MRKLTALLCFSLIFSAAWAADPAPPSPADTYIMARDRYIAQFAVAKPSANLDRQHELALADLERQLTVIIPPWKAPGFPVKGRINLDTLVVELGFGRLDGLVYETEGTKVVVTTPSLLRHWIVVDKNARPDGATASPSTAAALRSEPFWTFVMFNDAAAWSYGAVPVRHSRKEEPAAVLLVAFAQDSPSDAGPSHIAAAVTRSGRVFVALKTFTGDAPPVCRSALERVRGMASYDPDKADRDYRTCFAAHLRQQPHYKAIVHQAQALVDQLH